MIQSLLAASATSVSSAAANTSTKSAAKGSLSGKNIIFISADQLAASFLNCYGSGVNSTPTLDQLAQMGTMFERCYATCPICAPDRATWLTGRSPVIHGIISNNYALATDTPTYAHVLRRSGYRTGAFGKIHQTPMHLPVPSDLHFLGFDESVVTEDPKWGPWIDWIEEEHPDQYENALALCWGHSLRKNRAAQAKLAHKARQKILQPLFKKSGWKTMYSSPLPAELHDTTFITNCSLDFMTRHLKDHPGRPFLCHVSYVDPHDPYNPPKPYDTMFNPDDMKDPFPAEWEGHNFRALLSNQNSYLGFNEIKDKPQLVRKMRALFHGSVKFIDDQIARIVSFVKDNNLWENTVIMFTTDHGEMMGDHGLIAKGTPHYDAGIRIPLIAAGAGITPQKTDRLTCTLDYFPTFCDWAQVPSDNLPPLEGKSFASVCSGSNEKQPWSEIAVSVSTIDTVITDDYWRLTRFSGEDKGQMFNLKKDPAEQNNLYYDPAYTDKKTELLQRLVKVINRPSTIPNYRNLPFYEGRKQYIGGVGGGLFTPGPIPYKSPPNPYLE